MQPEQAGFLLHDVLLSGFRNEHRITKAVIAAIPSDRGDYRPDEVSKTALELAWHIVGAEMRFLDAITAGAFDFTPNPKPETVQTSEDLVTWYAEHLEPRLGKLNSLSNEDLTKIIDFRGAFQLPAVMFLLFVQQHSVHHRGQLSMYLRPMGAKVPAIYGESYDSAQARKAAAS